MNMNSENTDEKNENLIFQVLEWDNYHCDDDYDTEKKNFVIQAFGRTKTDETVYLEIKDFKPFFFVKLDERVCQSKDIDDIVELIKTYINNSIRVPIKNDDGTTEWIKREEGLDDCEIVTKKKFWGFTDYEDYDFLQLNFNDMDSLRSCERMFKKGFNIKKKDNKILFIKGEIYESNISPILRFMHIRELTAVGWLSIAKKDLDKNIGLSACCNLNYSTNWENVNNVNDISIGKMKIMAFDIECTSEDGSFPQPERPGDKVIQIGMTVSRFGSDENYDKYLLSLDETSDIEGTVVKWFKTEKDLFLEFTKILREIDPDIVTGYNIFGFDFTYMKKRADYLANTMDEKNKNMFLDKFTQLSRINRENSEWKEAQLASSALGENILRYWKMTGRIIIDLMKAVQGNPAWKLSSYKLDNVAAHFIREYITNISKHGENQWKIDTKSTFGLEKGNYITICYNDGVLEEKYENGKKFSMIDFGKNYIIVEGNIDSKEFMNKGYKVFWTQAKDDITPNDIFTMYKNDAKDRAIIGKYCVQDCILCNKLISKLQIVTNNIGMANVCHVPFSYLFLRGQGIKIFSLVAKKCRIENHLIPVIKKKIKKDNAPQQNTNTNIKTKNVDELDDKKLEKQTRNLIYKNVDLSDSDEEDEGYEGAIVFEPQPGVYFEPIPVLDYASLYPNSMILRNLSHETLVNDENYDNLPEYRYHSIKYKQNNGTMVECKFAEKRDGTKGIIPQILIDLLVARKKYKKEMNNATDPFTIFILDGLQQAYKTTANSLYGQTGASTSAICMKEIAASTTATGREMLKFSRHFIEKIYSKIINLALVDKTAYYTEMESVFQYFPTKIDIIDLDGMENVIHVNTDENDLIPNKKFQRNIIGYEHVYEFPKDIKFLDTMIKKLLEMNLNLAQEFVELFEKCVFDRCETFYERCYDIFNKNKEQIDLELISKILRMKQQQKQDLFCHLKIIIISNKLLKTLNKLSAPERTNFKKYLYTWLKKKKFNENDFKNLFKKFQTIWEDSGYDKFTMQWDFINEIKCFDEKMEEIFKEYIDAYIDDMGYNNKNQMFDKFYETIINTLNGHSISAEIIYGDTDSVFFCPHIKNNKTGELRKDDTSLHMGIKLGIWASILISTLLPEPMAQEYEKVLWPFIIQGKKRYVGNLYEKDPNSFKQKCMGIELKRRDNAPIVKIISKGIIDKILNERDPIGAFDFVRNMLKKIVTKEFEIDKFVITKTLKGNAMTQSERIIESKKPKEQRKYADRTRIVHVVLADRMADRDPGNRPLSNERIPYVYIEIKFKSDIQGDRVETPTYVLENNLKIDYLFYITNQIMKPSMRFLDLITTNGQKMFDDCITREENRKNGLMPLSYYVEENNTMNIDDFFDSKKIETVKIRSQKPKIVKKQNNTIPFDLKDLNLF